MTTIQARRASWLAKAALGALAIGLAIPANAQTAEEVPETEQATASPAEQGAPDTQATEDIIVTGSRIRGVAPVGSNVISIDQAKIAQEPVTSTNDLLRRVPQVVSLGANRAGGSAQNGAANATRGAGINLRGLSTNATLLLYDGRRLPPQGTQGQFTDPSVLPSIALGRVEVVADGASAIYGSDAIAGVVNFILRKDLDGIEGRARYGFTDSNYDEKQAALIAGKKWDGGYAMLAGEYTANAALYGSDLDFYQNDNRDRGGRDLRVTNCDPGTITVGGGTYAIPTGGVTSANVGSLVRGTANRCFYGGLDPVIAEQQRYSVTGAFGQEITDGIRVFADGFYSYRKGKLAINPTINATVRNTNPFFVSPVAGATSVQVAYSLVPTIGLQYNPFHSESWNVSGGVEAKLFSDFKGTVYYAHGESEEVADRRYSGVNAGALAAALADTNPATALNLFGGPNNPATIARITDNLFVITGRTRLDVINGQVDGSLFALPGGNVRIALGGEHRVEYTYSDLLTGQAATPVSVNDAGSRTVNAAFGELFVPVVGSANAMSGIEQLTLSLALRYEHYSDFGSTTNPKFGLTYKPFQGLTLRGSYGTSFRAPTFAEKSTVAGGAGLYFDTLPGAAGNQIGIGIAGGNPNLKPETAKTWSFGVEAAPVEIPGLRASVTYFRINYTDQIQALRGTAGLLTSPLYASFVQLNPSAATIAALVGSGLPINAAIDQSQVTFIADGRRQNLGTTLLRGLDFGLNYDWNMGDVRLDAGIQGTYILDYRFEAVPGSGLRDVLDTFGFAQKFRTQADVGMQWGGLRSRFTWNHLNGYDNNTVAPIQAVGNYDTFDLSVGYAFNDHLTLTGDVRNLFDENPPFVDTAGGYDPQSANPVPRIFSVTAQVKF
ncbi:TonB-dependent receptor [Sphingomonas hylomeconis]|uniref:TonB-dependent receptor n=1 Tax=Sphingomonas hylomeconis TaxID=1395958 RepID=A0ABV7SVA5_9SPHN|nr:TonB-dependent receptor [Sphingomonas hylomeconis]